MQKFHHLPSLFFILHQSHSLLHHPPSSLHPNPSLFHDATILHQGSHSLPLHISLQQEHPRKPYPSLKYENNSQEQDPIILPSHSLLKHNHPSQHTNYPPPTSEQHTPLHQSHTLLQHIPPLHQYSNSPLHHKTPTKTDNPLHQSRSLLQHNPALLHHHHSRLEHPSNIRRTSNLLRKRWFSLIRDRGKSLSKDLIKAPYPNNIRSLNVPMPHLSKTRLTSLSSKTEPSLYISQYSNPNPIEINTQFLSLRQTSNPYPYLSKARVTSQSTKNTPSPFSGQSSNPYPIQNLDNPQSQHQEGTQDDEGILRDEQERVDLESNDWVLDEEAVFTSNINTPWKDSSTGGTTDVSQWWKVTSTDDPAAQVEPAQWDGEEGGMDEDQPLSFQSYEVLQDGWTEEAVTSLLEER